MAPAEFEDVAGPDHVDVEDLQGVVEVVLDSDDGRQVKNDVNLRGQRTFECGHIGDITLDETESGVVIEVDAGVPGVFCDVKHRHGVVALQQCGHQMGTDQAVAAGDDNMRHGHSFVVALPMGWAA